MVEERLRNPETVRRTAALDDAHLGDIRGAFGTIREQEHATHRTWRRRLLALAVIMGPGLIVMVGDNDAGGVATYAQAGQNYGTSLLWVLVLLIPVLIVNQEMVVRLGAVTGVGHGRLIFERFGKFWGWFSVGDLFLLNFLTITTEFIGIGLGANYFGVSPYIAVPVGALFLIGITVDRELLDLGAAHVRSSWEATRWWCRSSCSPTPPRPVLHGFLARASGRPDLRQRAARSSPSSGPRSPRGSSSSSSRTSSTSGSPPAGSLRARRHPDRRDPVRARRRVLMSPPAPPSGARPAGHFRRRRSVALGLARRVARPPARSSR